VNGAPVEQWDEDRSEVRRQRVWEAVKAKSQKTFRVKVPAMFHSNFQDAALLSPDSMPENLRKNRFGKIDGLKGVNLSKELLIKFFEAELNGIQPDEFFAVQNKYPEIKIVKD
jgi:hypothetical protein